MTTYFISDLHLSAARPPMVAAFLSFIQGPAQGAEALYMLGDLFDQWLGDDDDTPPHPEIIGSLAQLTAAGVPVAVVRGNHDFLLGPDFERQTGCRLLADPSLIDVQGTRVLIMHGDTLCTDDREYQALRAQVRDPQNQQRFLALPLAARSAQAARLRANSRERTQLKPQEIMDVNPDAVTQVLRAHDVQYLIHGHTHRPAVHHHDIEGKPAQRIVLGDWYTRTHVLAWDKRGYRVLTGDSRAPLTVARPSPMTAD